MQSGTRGVKFLTRALKRALSRPSVSTDQNVAGLMTRRENRHGYYEELKNVFLNLLSHEKIRCFIWSFFSKKKYQLDCVYRSVHILLKQKFGIS